MVTEMIEKYEKEFLEEREEYINFVDESYKNKDWFPGVHYLSKLEKKDLVIEKLNQLIKEIGVQEDNAYFLNIKNQDCEISINDSEIKKYKFIKNIAIIKKLYGINELEKYLKEFDSNEVKTIEIKKGILNIVEFNIKKTKLADLDGYYKIYKLNDGIDNTIIILEIK